MAEAGLPSRLDVQTVLSMAKLPRNLLVSALYNRRRSADLPGFLGRLGDITRGRLLCVVAFNKPWVIDLMIRACRKHLPDWQLAIFDNSNKAEFRAEIARICAGFGTPYLALPRNPEWSPNRSHAVALNWIHANVIRRARPAVFGFLDHDCFPVASPPLDRIAGQPVYGLRRHSKKVPLSWYLWAGYMFFNRDLVGDRRLDFNHDQIRHLDTGGRNWVHLYRHIDAAALQSASTGLVSIASVDEGRVVDVQCIDGAFFHVGGLSYRRNSKEAEDFLVAVKTAVTATLD